MSARIAYKAESYVSISGALAALNKSRAHRRSRRAGRNENRRAPAYWIKTRTTARVYSASDLCSMHKLQLPSSRAGIQNFAPRFARTLPFQDTVAADEAVEAAAVSVGLHW